MTNFQIASGFAIHFNKELLCVGEAAKVVVSKLRPTGDYRIVAKLETPEGPLLTSPEITILEQAHVDFINIETNVLDPGPYIIRIYFAPSQYQGRAEVPERYTIADHEFQLLPFDQYEVACQELFGGDWDEPMYSDSQDWRQLSEFFAIFNARTTDDDLKHIKNIRAKPAAEETGGDYSWSRDSWVENTSSGLLLKSIKQVVEDAMQVETRRPFYFYYSLSATGVPHVDLTKYVWLLNVLASTWTDIFFFSPSVRLDINASEESFELTVYSTPDAQFEIPEAHWLIPSEEPPLFQVVRNTIGTGLNCQLSYDADSGVNLIVRSNKSFLSMSARQANSS